MTLTTNPHWDEIIRSKLYNSYVKQMPMFDHPGDFNVGGCYNCNDSFKLGSGMGAQDFYNAYNAPSQFFYVPTKLDKNVNYVPYEGAGKRKKKKKNRNISQVKFNDFDDDWYSTLKQLVPIGLQIGDIIKVFYDTFSKKYGSSLMGARLGHKVKEFIDSSSSLGYKTYM